MKKTVIAKFSALLIFSSVFFISCLPKKTSSTTRIKVLTSTFPVYDWTRNLINESQNSKIFLNVISKSAYNIHKYELTQSDITSISNAELIVYLGTESDSWISKAFEQAPANPNQKVINLYKSIQQNAPELFDNNLDKEHFWLSPLVAKECCKIISQELINIDSIQSDFYKKNNDDYIAQLDLLDIAFQTTASKNKDKTYIFCDYFPFSYLFDSYNINYLYTTTVCNAQETSAQTIDNQTISLLGAKIDELNANGVYVTELSDKKIARQIISASKNPSCDIIVLDSMHSITLNQAFKGSNYIDITRNNLNLLNNQK